MESSPAVTDCLIYSPCIHVGVFLALTGRNGWQALYRIDDPPPCFRWVDYIIETAADRCIHSAGLFILLIDLFLIDPQSFRWVFDAARSLR